MAADDLGVRAFTQILAQLPAKVPITEAYDLMNRKNADSKRWYQNQKEHMVGWFSSQNTKGSGQYTRNTGNRSARTAYNRLLSPGGILWINEALGQDTELVQQAAKAASEEPQYRSRCGLILELLPWEQVAVLAWKNLAGVREARAKVAVKSSREISTKPYRAAKARTSVVKAKSLRRKPK